MLKKFRKPIVGWSLTVVYLLGNFFPTAAIAFHGGPGQPETQNFTPSDVTELVDPFTGDFSYNINLMDVGGYPINLSYRSGVGMNDEASFVGLGWSLNPGAINRQVRGLPDDFKADTVNKAYNMRPDLTLGMGVGANLELFGFDAAQLGVGLQLGVSKNSYRGFGLDVSTSSSIQIASQHGSPSLSGSLSIGLSSTEGAYFNPNAGLQFASQRFDRGSSVGLEVGTHISSREGLKDVTFRGSYTRSLLKNLRSDVKKNKTTSVGGNFPISFASPTFTPTSDIPLRNISLSTRFKLGGEIYGTMVDFFASGYFTLQELSKKNEQFPAYGYLYAHEANEGRVLTDFNREKDGPYQKELPALPLTNFTYDVYAVSGQGISGQFRPFRSDIGTLSDTYSSNQSTGINTGAEIALGNLIHGGGDLTINQTSDHTSKWQSDNGLSGIFNFRGSVEGNAAYELAYFKSVGEKTAMINESLFNRVGAFDPVYAPVGNGSTGNQLVNGNTRVATSLAPNQNFKTVREPRNIHFSYLTAHEASRMGIDSIKNYNSGRSEFIDDIHGTRTFELVSHQQSRTGGVKKPHHLSEITVTRDDGARYVYGLPVYNVKQKEVSFNVSKNIGADGSALFHDTSTGLVTYFPDHDNSTNNSRGLDQYFHSEETPAHASAFLLTSILSDDYIDITANGPTPDDFGTYTRFNYTQAHSEYKWRTPYQQNRANYQEGSKSDQLDDKGSYVYGEKEVWYIQNIETKNYVAEFTLSDREDAHGVLNENGGPDNSQKLKKLDKITLYTQSDRIMNGPDANPIKTVYFNYNYSLCQNTPGATTGKLTLTKVSFSYGHSYKGRLSPYEFTYSATNPAYHIKESDRWGTYKVNEPTLDNTQFPYTRQAPVTNGYASAWALTRIKLPSGGVVNVTYESDDYAYVQDKRAMEMVRILGIRNNHTDTRPLNPTDNKLYEGSRPNQFLFFALKEATNDPQLLHEYVDGLEELYFNCDVHVSARYSREKIQGFAPIGSLNTFGVNYGFFDGSLRGDQYTIGWIKLPVVSMGDTDDIVEGTEGAHPIAKATWQELRKNLPRVAYDKPEPTHIENYGDFDGFIAELGSLIEEVNRTINGFNQWMQSQHRGNSIDLAKSFIRLNSPDKKKFGGGSRVKLLTISDEWGNMVPSVPEITNFAYGQEYQYTSKESLGDSVRTISSGVAAYEPLIGGDENPFAMPSRYRIATPLALGLNLYMMEPFGESFFPSPTVGYSNVVIKNLAHEGVNRTATGYTQHEFYTAKDFPTFVQRTDLQAVPYQTPPNPFYSELKATVSQGYSIELNDMHGKPKAQKIFQEINAEYPISGLEYIYRTDPGNPHRLNNRVTVLDDSTGMTREKLVGVEYDFIVDAREMKRESWGPGVQINTDGFLASIVPIFVALPYPEFAYSQSQYRGITTTKVIQRSGLIEEVVAYDLGSRITTSNLVYDAKTGNELVTKTKNEFDDDYYTTHVPAHWVYDGMGSAYRNSAIAYKDQTARNGQFSIPLAASNFVRGDELMVFRKDVTEAVVAETGGTPAVIGRRYSPYTKGWVYLVDNTSITVIDRLGQPIENGQYDLKIVRSGRRNKQFASLGSVTTKNNPVASRRINFTEVINAAAIEYQEHWQTYAGFLVPLPESTCHCIPKKGDFQGSISLVGAFNVLRALTLSGDYKRDSVALNRPEYASGYLNHALGHGEKTYFGEVNGNFVEAAIRNNRDGVINDCSVRMEMADPSLTFPDSIVNITLPNPLFNPEDFTCGNVYNFNVVATYLDALGNRKTGLIKFSSSCFRLFECYESVSEFPPMTCDIASGTMANPFLLGILGNWRPKATYTYVTERTTGRIDKKGVFSTFHTFWNPIHLNLSPVVDKSTWQWAQQNTITDPFGKLLEQKDPLNRYASSIYGYGFNVPVASAKNARYHQIAFDGFEDYAYTNTVSSPFEECPLPPHWKFDATKIQIDETQSHTGQRSLRVHGEEKITSVITPLCDPDLRTVPAGNTYPIQDCDLIRKFAPPPGKYLLQAWVKEATSASELITNYTHASIDVAVTTDGITTIQTITSKGRIIEGWQPLEDSFVIPQRCERVSISLKCSRTAYFDDLRLQPFAATMEAYVYNPTSLRLVATLDDRNYATFYEYNKEGNLVRTKKETESGILTLQEVRTANRKN